MTGIFKNTAIIAVALFFTTAMTLSVTTAQGSEAMNPCSMGAKKMNPCSMGAKKMNPCSMGHAKKMNPCSMGHAKKMNPCSMGHAKKMNPCSMGAKKMNPCSAAKSNPCSAAKNNPCNPAPISELSNKDAAKIYKRISGKLRANYAKSGLSVAREYYKWSRFNKVPYISDTHGSRYVNNYSNRKKYGKFEKAGKMTVGTIVAKDSFRVSPAGKVQLGPLFVMQKMKAGFKSEDGDWRYTMIMPNGSVMGVTKGKGSQYVQFCASCHNAAEDNDMMFFIPEEYRK